MPSVISPAFGTALSEIVSDYDIAFYFFNATGVKGRALATAVAIALAESGGNHYAHCLNCVPGVREDSRGLWQINVDAHPQYAGQDLYNPQVNARAAADVSGGGGNFRPWSTYVSGAYVPFMARGMTAAAAIGSGVGKPRVSGGPTIGDVVKATPSILGTDVPAAAKGIGKDLNPLSSLLSVAELLGKAAGWIANPHNWLRVVEVLAGAAGLLIGAVLLSRQFETTRSIEDKGAEAGAIAAA